MKISIIEYLVMITLFVCISNCNRNKNVIANPPKNNTLTLGDTLNISFKDTLFNYDENIWLSFDSLISDSRCPVGTMCIWEGNAEVSFVLNSKQFDLNTHPSFTTDTTILDHPIHLVDVRPYPHIDSLFTVYQYSVQVVVNQ